MNYSRKSAVTICPIVVILMCYVYIHEECLKGTFRYDSTWWLMYSISINVYLMLQVIGTLVCYSTDSSMELKMVYLQSG